MMDESLVEIIKSARKEIPHEQKVVYDLTQNLEISHPGTIGEALAKAVFDEDVSKWVKVYDYGATVEAAWDVEIIMHDEHYKKVQKAAFDFKKDLKKQKLMKDLSGEIVKQGKAMSKMSEYLVWTLVGGLGLFDTIEHDYAVGKLNAEGYVGSLITDIMNHITVLARK